jgi:hypothetical protein
LSGDRLVAEVAQWIDRGLNEPSGLFGAPRLLLFAGCHALLGALGGEELRGQLVELLGVPVGVRRLHNRHGGREAVDIRGRPVRGVLIAATMLCRGLIRCHLRLSERLPGGCLRLTGLLDGRLNGDRMAGGVGIGQLLGETTTLAVRIQFRIEIGGLLPTHPHIFVQRRIDGRALDGVPDTAEPGADRQLVVGGNRTLGGCREGRLAETLGSVVDPPLRITYGRGRRVFLTDEIRPTLDELVSAEAAVGDCAA